MANVIVEIRIMPDTPETDLGKVYQEIVKLAKDYGDVAKYMVQPVAFGINALTIYIIAKEEKGSADPLCEKFAKIPGVQSAEVTDVRREIEELKK